MTSTRAARAAALLRLVDAGDAAAIRFVQAAPRTVHVLAPADFVPDRHRELFGDSDGEVLMRTLLGQVWTVCGVGFHRHRGGFERGAALVSHFPDELLCHRCCTAFGDRAVVLFEANRDDGAETTQLGRRGGDTVRRRPPLR